MPGGPPSGRVPGRRAGKQQDGPQALTTTGKKPRQLAAPRRDAGHEQYSRSSHQKKEQSEKAIPSRFGHGVETCSDRDMWESDNRLHRSRCGRFHRRRSELDQRRSRDCSFHSHRTRADVCSATALRAEAARNRTCCEESGPGRGRRG